MSRSDPEFQLLVDCCRRPADGAARQLVREHGAGVAWARFLRLAQRHRVEGLVWRSLSAASATLPPEIAAALERSALRIARHNLLAAAECERLRDAFSLAGIDILFIKGPTLAALAYGSIVPKASSDVDILVAPERLLPASETLRSLGYRPVLPYSGNSDSIARWHSWSKESVWLGPAGSTLELHTSLADHPELISAIGMDSPRQMVEIGSPVRLETLCREELFSYLCVHGASSAWFRLKWLADLAALLANADESETGRLYEGAVRLGAGTPAAAGLMLAHRFFDTPVAPARLRAWRTQPSVRLLVHASIKSMTGARGEAELDRVFLGSIWIHLAQLGMVRSLKGKIGEIRRQLLLSRRGKRDKQYESLMNRARQ